MISISKEAMQHWNKIPENIRVQLLSNVYCSNCSDITTIVNYQAEIVDNDLILKGKCKKCNHNVTRLIEAPEDNYIDDETELSCDEIDKLISKQQAQNHSLINIFEQYLICQNLSKKTIKKHCDNVDFYINTYLLHDSIEKPEDNLNNIDMYFDYFMPRKTLFGSINDTKNQITSLKKFYKLLEELNRISKDEYSELLQIIKDNKQRWFDIYDNDDIYDE